MSALYDHACRLCPLHEHAQTVCVERTPHRVRAMIVGEAPGRNEDEQGVPFVGQAGRVLNKALVSTALRREDVAITNAVKCRPLHNATPRWREVETCVSAYLTHEIVQVDPLVILAVGNVAAQALLRQTGVTSLRGTWHRLDSDAERWVRVTWHPAYVLKNGLDSQIAYQFAGDVFEWAETYEFLKKGGKII